MPTVALSRVAVRAVESGPDGENLASGAWQRLEALPRHALTARADLPAGLLDRGRGGRHPAFGGPGVAGGHPYSLGWRGRVGGTSFPLLLFPWDCERPGTAAAVLSLGLSGCSFLGACLFLVGAAGNVGCAT